jgi:hypothetical protein
MTARRATRRPATGRARKVVERARRDLDGATRTLAERAAALARVADEIAAAATEAERDRLAAEIVADRIPRDLLELREALASAPPGSLAPALEVMRKLPDMALGWLQRHLELVPSHRPGDQLQVPAERLASFDVDGPLPAAGLVSIRILSPGWKRGARVLARPRALLLR